jgi:hypothetical protein
MLTLYTLLSTRRREQIRTHLANLSLCKRNAS